MPEYVCSSTCGVPARITMMPQWSNCDELAFFVSTDANAPAGWQRNAVNGQLSAAARGHASEQALTLINNGLRSNSTRSPVFSDSAMVSSADGQWLQPGRSIHTSRATTYRPSLV